MEGKAENAVEEILEERTGRQCKDRVENGQRTVRLDGNTWKRRSLTLI